METAKLFMDEGSKAVRLPDDCGFAGDEVYLTRVGNAIVLLPGGDPWEPLFAAAGEFSPDFMEKRDQGEFQEREAIFE